MNKDKEFRENAALNLRQLREQKGLTQSQLAKEMRVSQRTISLIETGKSLSVRMLRKLSRFFDVSMEEITG